jgi:hypothetical protein
MTRLRRCWPRHPVIGASTVLVSALATMAAAALPLDPLPKGWKAAYYGTLLDRPAAPIIESIDPEPSTEAIASHPDVASHATFSVVWTGTLVVREPAIHRIALKSGAASDLTVGTRLVIDNTGAHGTRSVSADVRLGRGAHRVVLRVMHAPGDDPLLQLAEYSSGAQALPLGPVIAADLTYRDALVRGLWPLGLVALWYAAACALLMAMFTAVIRPSAAWQSLTPAFGDRWFVVAASLGLAAGAAHLLYGLPSSARFSPDELEPLDLLRSSARGFLTWNLRWPPGHALLATAWLQPFDWAARAFALPLDDALVAAAMHVAIRVLSLAMLGGTLLFTYAVGVALAGAPAARWAVLLLAWTPAVAYFGPLTNLETPHLFWMTASWWAWLMLWRAPVPSWFAIFGVTVGASLATKDQAYGYYVIAPIALLAAVARHRRASGRLPWIAALADRRLFIVGLATVATFAAGHLLPWRWDRFVQRIDVLTGIASQPFMMVAPTMSGQATLIAITIKVLVWAAGLPLVPPAIAGATLVVLAGNGRRLAAMAVPLAAYYLTFIVVILYVYDRFLIAWLPPLAVLGGIALARASRERSWWLRRLVPGVVIGASALNVLAMNVVFTRDPRYAATTWLQLQVPCGSSIGVTYSTSYLPPLDCYDVQPLTAEVAETMTRGPEFFVFNEAYAERFRATPSGKRFFERLESGELGYTRAFRAESAAPRWAPLYREARFANGVEDVETTADKPLHAIEIWQRPPAAGSPKP